MAPFLDNGFVFTSMEQKNLFDNIIATESKGKIKQDQVGTVMKNVLNWQRAFHAKAQGCKTDILPFGSHLGLELNNSRMGTPRMHAATLTLLLSQLCLKRDGTITYLTELEVGRIIFEAYRLATPPTKQKIVNGFIEVDQEKVSRFRAITAIHLLC